MSGHRADNNVARRSTDLAETRDRKAASCVRSGLEEAMASLVQSHEESTTTTRGEKKKAKEESHTSLQDVVDPRGLVFKV